MDVPVISLLQLVSEGIQRAVLAKHGLEAALRVLLRDGEGERPFVGTVRSVEGLWEKGHGDDWDGKLRE